jgi:predicted kinase
MPESPADRCKEALRPTLVIVSGLPATGKSSLAEALRDALGWPLFTKDRFKELLYDVADRGASPFTRDDSRVIGQQSIALLSHVARELLESGDSCILEANYIPEYAPADLAPLLALADGKQVHCSIPDDLVLERYRERAKAGERHPVHVDEGAEAELAERIAGGGGRALPIDAALLEVDATDGFKPGIEEIAAFCRS